MSAPGVWGLRGIVVRGHQRGGTMLGFPTANVYLDDATIARLAPMSNGVFYGWAAVEPDTAAVYPMVLSVGFNPHFKDQHLTVEVHFMHKFTGDKADFYGASMRLVALGRLRDQKAYEGLESLIADINGDVRAATALLAAPAAAAAKEQHPMLRIPAKQRTAMPLLLIDGEASNL
jgi:riboflavin kinase